MGIVIHPYFHSTTVPRTSYKYNMKSLPSLTTIKGCMKDFRIWREETTIPFLANTMTQRSISYLCVGSTHAARGSRCDLEGANKQKSIFKFERNQCSLHNRNQLICVMEKRQSRPCALAYPSLFLSVAMGGGLQPPLTPRIRPSFPGYKWCQSWIGPTILAFMATLAFLLNVVI